MKIQKYKIQEQFKNQENSRTFPEFPVFPEPVATLL